LVVEIVLVIVVAKKATWHATALMEMVLVVVVVVVVEVVEVVGLVTVVVRMVIWLEIVQMIGEVVVDMVIMEEDMMDTRVGKRKGEGVDQGVGGGTEAEVDLEDVEIEVGVILEDAEIKVLKKKGVEIKVLEENGVEIKALEGKGVEIKVLEEKRVEEKVLEEKGVVTREEAAEAGVSLPNPRMRT